MTPGRGRAWSSSSPTGTGAVSAVACEPSTAGLPSVHGIDGRDPASSDGRRPACLPTEGAAKPTHRPRIMRRLARCDAASPSRTRDG